MALSQSGASVVAIGALLMLLVVGTGAHTYHTGECPSVEPMSGFEMRQVSVGIMVHYYCCHVCVCSLRLSNV